jgi:hypothetical protein
VADVGEGGALDLRDRRDVASGLRHDHLSHA